jgi:cbb3-type cytochrome oxidase subunit 1
VHSLVRRFIKTAIIFLAVGLAIGGYLIVGREVGGGFPNAYVVSAHTHAILVGFVMMMILGVALWLFPRPERDDTLYDPTLVSGAYWTITLATAARIAGELARAAWSPGWLRWTVAIAGLAQIAGFVLFFYTMWGRIRAAGSRQRESSGERF